MSSFLHEVTVRAVLIGKIPLSFPVDMLRYDMLAPRNSEAMEAIATSLTGEREVECFCPHQPETWPTVTLVREGQKQWKPTAGRWSSFGWEVIEHKVSRI